MHIVSKCIHISWLCVFPHYYLIFFTLVATSIVPSVCKKPQSERKIVYVLYGNGVVWIGYARFRMNYCLLPRFFLFCFFFVLRHTSLSLLAYWNERLEICMSRGFWASPCCTCFTSLLFFIFFIFNIYIVPLHLCTYAQNPIQLANPIWFYKTGDFVKVPLAVLVYLKIFIFL